jgi:hypothetical protein
MTTHNFDKSLSDANEASDQPWWEAVYRQAFPGFNTMMRVTDNDWGQRKGHDRVITLSSGKSIRIDEKIRYRTWTDVLLEEWSCIETKAPGWTERDLECDYIAYAFVDSRVCYMLPFQQLRRAWLTNKDKWKQQYGSRPTKSERNGRTYTTIWTPVPIAVVLLGIQNSFWTNWGESQLEIRF